MFVVVRRPGNCQLRVVLETASADFSTLWASTLSAPYADFIEVMYLDISLHCTGVDNVVEQAREQGFFFGALMVERGGLDRLRLQCSQSDISTPDAMVICFQEGEELLGFVVSDSDKQRP